MDVRGAVSALIVLAPLALGGCVGVGNVNYPPISGQTAGSDLNQPAAQLAMTAALIWVTRRYPPVNDPMPGADYREPLAMNLPPGVSRTTYLAVERDVSVRNAYARALSAETSNLPTYHVTRVTVRGTDALVDILVPKYNLGPGTSGEQLYMGVSVDLRGGLKPWEYYAHRTFPVNMADVPAPNPCPPPPPGP